MEAKLQLEISILKGQLAAALERIDDQSRIIDSVSTLALGIGRAAVMQRSYASDLATLITGITAAGSMLA